MGFGTRARAIVWSLLAAVALLAAGEVAVRRLSPGPRSGVLTQPPALALYPGLARPEEVFSSLDHDGLQWSPYLHWTTRPHLRTRFFTTNALGLRGPEVQVPKPKDRFRVVVLGGSVAWGLGSTADERTVAGWLQAELRARLPGRDLEVVNAGQPGFVSGQELLLFHRSLAALAPDLVLLLDGYNDVEADLTNPTSDWPQNAAQLRTRYEDFLRSGRLGADLGRFLGQSRLVELLQQRLRAGRAAAPWAPVVPTAATAESYARNAAAIARLAAPAPVWVALQPVVATTSKPLAPEEQRMLDRRAQAVAGYAGRVRDSYRAMAAAASRAGLPVVPLDGALGTEPVLLFADECHFGDEAARRVARAVAEAWLARQAIPTDPGPQRDTLATVSRTRGMGPATCEGTSLSTGIVRRSGP
jgi:lysophospholipase L1-like esterase